MAPPAICRKTILPHKASSIVFKYWPQREDTCNDCKFVQRVVPLASVANLATKWHKMHWFNLVIRWRHLHCFQSWPPGRVTCIATLAWIAYWHYQLVLSWYLHQPESHQFSLNKVSDGRTDRQTDGHPDTKIGPGIPGSDENSQLGILLTSPFSDGPISPCKWRKSDLLVSCQPIFVTHHQSAKRKHVSRNCFL